MPRDKVRYSRQGKLFIDGKLHLKTTSQVRYKEAAGVKIFENTAFVVPQNNYFALEDNRNISNDGHIIVLFPKKKIIGIVKLPFGLSKHKVINSVPIY